MYNEVIYSLSLQGLKKHLVYRDKSLYDGFVVYQNSEESSDGGHKGCVVCAIKKRCDYRLYQNVIYFKTLNRTNIKKYANMLHDKVINYHVKEIEKHKEQSNEFVNEFQEIINKTLNELL